MTTLYRSKTSLLHRYDPRAKLVNVLSLVAVFFLPLRVAHLAVYLAAAAALIVIFLGAGELWRALRMILPILVLVLLLTPPFHREGSPLLSIRGVALVTEAGVMEALRLVVRFTGITFVFFIYLRTTDPEELVLSLRWFGLPFGAAQVISIALQYIPTIKVLYDQVRDAHRLRQAGLGDSGATSRRTGLRRRVSRAIPALTSVLILSVRRIPVLAMVLESRGVGRRNRRSAYHALPSGGALLRAAAVALGVEALLLIVTVLLFP